MSKTTIKIGFLPTSQPGVVNYVGECGSSTYLCGLCEGDCDSDSDCEGDLVCMQRESYEGVSGCTGEGGDRDMYGKDVCVSVTAPTPSAPTPTPPTVVVDYVGNPCNDFFPDRLCDICTGDCDSDSDCDAGLRCAQRSRTDGLEIVPGCDWGGNASLQNDDSDYCKLCNLFIHSLCLVTTNPISRSLIDFYYTC